MIKGPVISKGFLVPSVSSKTRTKTHRIAVKANSLIHFLEDFTALQFAFKINQPLNVYVEMPRAEMSGRLVRK